MFDNPVLSFLELVVSVCIFALFKWAKSLRS
jgi:hypothetical protein